MPTTYGHRDVLVRGYVHEVVISCGAEVIARHPRSYEREDFVFEPLHYLVLIEQKINALDQAAPLAGWQLPEEFATLRRLLEARMDKQGKREFVQVLRLMEVFRADDVAAAVRDAIARGAIGFEAVKHLVLCRIERRPPRLDMTVYPYLPQAHVAMTLAKTYLGLLTEAASGGFLRQRQNRTPDFLHRADCERAPFEELRPEVALTVQAFRKPAFGDFDEFGIAPDFEIASSSLNFPVAALRQRRRSPTSAEACPHPDANRRLCLRRSAARFVSPSECHPASGRDGYRP